MRDPQAALGGAILVFNAGSSSVKFALYRAGSASPKSLVRGEIESTGAGQRFRARDAAGGVLGERRWDADHPLPALLPEVADWVESHLGAEPLLAAGHRVALGTGEHSAPVRVDAALLARLRALVPLAPLHLPRNLEPIELLARRYPGLAQVACFDTAFHRTMPAVAQVYALPRALTEAGIRRYGFHGLSYESIALRLRELAPEAAAGRTVVAHLGSGASLCAMVDARSVATSMGFSPLSGIPMATRPGELDPGVLLWLMRERGMGADAIEAMLYGECGLAGVSGIAGDMRVLLASDDPRAKEAVDLFVYRTAREVASLAAAMGGLDALVFTAGIGENSPQVRAAVCEACSWLGVALDAAANARHGPRISTASSRASAWTIPTDEEAMVARETMRLLEVPADPPA